MREDAFRAYLTPTLTSGGVSSYLSCAKRVERTLHIDLDVADLQREALRGLAVALANAGVTSKTVDNCMSAVRNYAAFRSGVPKAPRAQSIMDRSGSSPPVVTPVPVGSPPPEPSHRADTALKLRSVPELMRLYAAILSELRHRSVLRTGNGPVGDYAEMLFADAFGWALSGNSTAGYDAIDAGGQRYQIKARRLLSRSSSRQLGAIRRLADKPFDALAVILFDHDLAISKAAIIPADLVANLARYNAYTNSWRLMVPDMLWTMTDVRDVTNDLQRSIASYGA